MTASIQFEIESIMLRPRLVMCPQRDSSEAVLRADLLGGDYSKAMIESDIPWGFERGPKDLVGRD